MNEELFLFLLVAGEDGINSYPEHMTICRKVDTFFLINFVMLPYLELWLLEKLS